jgi:outer membrane protein TolC
LQNDNIEQEKPMKQSMFYRTFGLAALLCLLLVRPSIAETLSLSQAETQALASDPMLKAYESSMNAYRQKAIAADTLPDPKLKLGLMNFPTDTYKRDQEPMTQLQVGIQQMFPRGDSLAIKSRRMNYMAEGEAARVANQYRNIRRLVRHTWLEIVYWEQARQVIKKNRELFKRLVDITRSQYASGRHRQQDVVRAQLELGMLDDRLTQIETMIGQARARLSRLMGQDIAEVPVETKLPQLPGIPDRTTIETALEQHPVLQLQQARLAASEQGVALARQSYKPSWMLDVTYGDRDGNNANGTERADFLSAMVVMDIPLFTGRRQDKLLSASQAARQSALSTREDRRRELVQQLNEAYVTWQRLEQRMQHYRDYVGPKARENAQAALQSYQSDRGDFTTLMRAQITELETSLKALRLNIDYIKTQATLLYLSGEPA